MCTVSFVPTNEGFIFTSNRDENPQRAIAIPPKKYLSNNKSLFFPKDPVGGGTWIVFEEGGYLLCLLNGAFSNHKKVANYKKSRGTMVLEFFQYASYEDFVNNYDFSGIEPFTLLIIHHATLLFQELVWDGSKITGSSKNIREHHIWSSSTLYSDDTKKLRKNWLNEYLQNCAIITQELMLKFHLKKSKEDAQNSLVMKRENMQTVSITSLEFLNNQNITMQYLDLQRKRDYVFKIMHMVA